MVGALLLGIALLVALATRGQEDTTLAEPTAIPLPTLAGSGEHLAPGDRFITRRALNLSVAASATLENPELALERCTAVTTVPQGEGGALVGFDADGYWVHVQVIDQPFLNGWVPLDALATSLLTCPTPTPGS
ncbi:MAG: hypothetical protein HC915_00385 [Anaerolineae bacterium]|nr:hypothetical protein [Anaerolineae bacterium]